MAILRTTPALLGLFALVTRWAHPRMGPTAALVRRELWAQTTFCLSPSDPDIVALPHAFVDRLTDALCYAA